LKMLRQPSATSTPTTSALGAEAIWGCTGGPVHLRRWGSIRSLEEKLLVIKGQERSCSPNQSSVGFKAGTCVNQSMCVLFSPYSFFALGFWDVVFSEAHMCRLQRTFLATRVRIVNMPLLTWSATRSRCAGRDRIAEGLLLGVRLGLPNDPLLCKRVQVRGSKRLFMRSRT